MGVLPRIRGSLTNKCIVLDLDETLICTMEKHHLAKRLIDTNPRFHHLRSRYYEFELDGDVMGGLMRPNLQAFLNFCFDYFQCVIVWSAGTKKYVEKICKVIFPGRKPHKIYSREKCIFDKNKNQIFKPLQRLVEDPTVPGSVTLQNTFAIDDRDDTFSQNVANGIQIPKWSPDAERPDSLLTEDRNLDKVMCWFLQREVMDPRSTVQDLTNIQWPNTDIFLTKSVPCNL